jgi:hypothetical protein
MNTSYKTISGDRSAGGPLCRGTADRKTRSQPKKMLFKTIKKRTARTAAPPPHKSGRGGVVEECMYLPPSFTMYKGMDGPRKRVKVRD